MLKRLLPEWFKRPLRPWYLWAWPLRPWYLWAKNYAPMELRYKTIFIARRLSGKGGSLYFFPSKPRTPRPAIYKICHELGLSMRHGVSQNGRTLFWPHSEKPDPHPFPGLINGHCIDINKTRVMRLFVDAFGYGYEVDPASDPTPYVRKSNLNARHDGVVCHEASGREPGYVYQRVIENTDGDGMVEDLRLIYIGSILDFAYRKIRPISDRFSNTNMSASMVRTSDVISNDERYRVSHLCEAIGLQYGETDVLRDRGDENLYLLDVSRCPFGPPNGLSQNEARLAVKLMGASFQRAFL